MGYRAFFSYSRGDDVLASWLHRQLDRYRAPKALVGTNGALGIVPAKLHPIFRDRTDLEAGGRIDRSLQRALEDSETLVVLCTPTSAKSAWVNHECETFLAMGREGRIFPVIGAGEPNSGDADTECFPPAIRGRGLLAADLREEKRPNGQLVGDGKESGRLRLIAGLLGVPLDALVQRERQRQRQLITFFAAAAIIFACTAALAGVQTYFADQNALEAQRQQQIAEDNAARERQAREAERQQRRRADAETLRAIANAEEAERQGGIASENALQARSTLNRFFATRAREEVEAGNYLVAARYALAGLRLSPENSSAYRNVLTDAAFQAGHVAHALVQGAPVSRAVYSPDGRVVISTGPGGLVKVWAASSARLLATLSGHTDTVQDACFSANGALVATAGSDRTVRIWRTEDWRQVTQVEGFFTSSIDHPCSVFTPDAARIVTALDDRKAVIWNAATGERSATLSGHTDAIESARFSPDGRFVVTASRDRRAIVWSDHGVQVTLLSGHRRRVEGASFSPDGVLIATAAEDGSVRLWRASDGVQLAEFAENEGFATSFAFSPDSQHLIVGYSGNVAKVWSLAQTNSAIVLRGHAGPVVAVAFAPDNTGRVVTGGSDRTARVWSAADGALLATLSGHDGNVSSVSFSPDGREVVTGSADGSAKIWDDLDGPILARLSGHTDAIHSVQFSPDGQRIVSGSLDNSAIVWSRSGERLATLDHPNLVSDVSFSPDSRNILTTAGDGLVRAWDATSGRVLINIPHQFVTKASFSPDGRSIVTAGGDRTVRLWDANTRRMMVLSGHEEPVGATAFSPDGRTIATGDGNGQIRLFNARNGALLRTITGHRRSIRGLAFSPDSRLLVSASADRTASIRVSATGGLVATLTPENEIEHAGFSPDGRIIVTTGGDGAIGFWDAADGSAIAHLTSHGGYVAAASFSPEGGDLVTVGSDNLLRIWRLGALAMSLRELEAYVCGQLLGSAGRRFSKDAINADALLRAQWSAPERDVCD